MDNLGAATYTVKADTTQFEKGIDKSEQVLQDLINQFKSTENQLTHLEKTFGSTMAVAANETTKLGHQGRGAALGILQLSYAIDDLQYGVGAVVNNIPQLVYMFGGGAGVAGAAGIAAVAVNLLVNHWSQLTDIAQSQWSGDSIAQLRALREHAEEAAKAFEKLAGTPTAAQGAQVSGVAGAITGAGTEGVTAALAAKLAQDPKIRNKVAPGINAFGNRFGFLARALSGGGSIERAIGDEARKQAEELIGATQKAGPAGEHARLELEQKLRSLGENGLADQIAQARDAAKNAQAAKDFAGERGGEHAMEEARKRALEQINKEILAKKELDMATKQEAKTKRIQELEDQRAAILQRRHSIAEDLWNQTHGMNSNVQILSGAKAVVDFYQTNARDSTKELARISHRLQEAANKKLESIDAELKKERRVVIPR